MASRRVLFRTLAEESLGNARRFFLDAKRLRRVGSRGHAIAFAVLSIEESSKALLYRGVAEGVLRIVRKNPNHGRRSPRANFSTTGSSMDSCPIRLWSGFGTGLSMRSPKGFGSRA